jgi:hypothetical protein
VELTVEQQGALRRFIEESKADMGLRSKPVLKDWESRKSAPPLAFGDLIQEKTGT